MLLLFGWIAIATAWLADDAFISFRQVLNALDGLGLTTNYGQRVQAFTHPAWVLLLTAVVAGTGEVHVTTIVVSIVLSLASIVWVVRYAWDLSPGQCRPGFLYAMLVILAFSKAFTDYMTSGLENALSYFLVGLAIWQSGRIEQDAGGRGRLMLVFGALALAFLNRFDYALLLLPLALHVLITARRAGALATAIPGALAIAAWMLFSIAYFGTPLPNTYYAKVVADFPASEIYQRGAAYYWVTLTRDPVTLVLVAFGALSGLLTASWRSRSLSIGIVLYATYVLSIGGDFMQGRFLAVPAYAAIFALIALDERRAGPFAFKTLSLVVSLGAVVPGPKPLLSDRTYRHVEFETGVADERGVWYERYGLRSPVRDWPSIGAAPTGRPDAYQVTCAGADTLERRDVMWIDICGLSDAFLARVPAIGSRDWRVGHLFRKVPTDYGDVLVGRTQVLADPGLQALFDDVQLAVSAPLWSAQRAGAIARLNFGHDYGLDRAKYADPAVVVPSTSTVTEVDYEQLDRPPPENGTQWLVRVVEGVVWPQRHLATDFSAGLSVTLRNPVSAVAISLSVDGNDAYRLIINEGDFDAFIEPSREVGPEGGLVTHRLELPRPMLVTHVRVEPVSGDGYYAVGHLRLEPASGSH